MIRNIIFFTTLFCVSASLLFCNSEDLWKTMNSPVEGSSDPYDSKLILIHGSTFNMGDETITGVGSVHKVTLTYDFYVSKYEVTLGEYKQYNSVHVNNNNDNNAPVDKVSWFDAAMYCNWKSKQAGLSVAYKISDGGNPVLQSIWNAELVDENGDMTTDITQVKGYRLLTEAEWEYSARYKGIKPGDTYSGSYNVDDVAWHSEAASHAIGDKKHNELYLYDMSGNILEWVHDNYLAYPSDVQQNPIGRDPASAERVLRGGAYDMAPGESVTAKRFYALDEIASEVNYGFRIGRTLD